MAITPLPSLDRTNVNFKANVDTFFSAQLPAFSLEAEAARADIVTKQGQAATSAANAAASEANALSIKNASSIFAETAATKAGEASTSASTASTKAGEASTKAGEAATSASSASTKASEAAASAANAASVLANSVQRTSATGSTKATVGTTGQRDAVPEYGWERTNRTLNQKEWWNDRAWVAMGGGATGGGTDAAVYENDLIATDNYTIGQYAMVSGATISIATPAVITLANNFIATQPVRFTTTGALPTGLSEDGAYFVSSAGLSATSFQVAATSAAAKAGTGSIATSGTQSGIHSAGKIKNALTGGPYTIADGVAYKLPTGATWTIT